MMSQTAPTRDTGFESVTEHFHGHRPLLARLSTAMR